MLNLSYSYQTGKFTQDRMLGGFINGWLISGITNIQSGPDMQTGVSYSPGYYLQGNIDQRREPVRCRTRSRSWARRTSTCSRCSRAIRARTSASHQYLNPTCFALPAVGTNGPYIEPYAHGPAFFNSDLSLEKGFSMGGERRLRFRYAAFNFLNHPLNSFGTGYASQTRCS